MTAKETVRALLERLPDDCSLDDVLYHLYVANAVEAGRQEVAVGEVVSQAEVEEELRRRWVLGADA